MTIAAGFVCSDGLVVCADTEYSNAVSKVSRTKIWRRAQGDLLIAAAGDEVLMNEAAQTLLETLEDDISLDDVKEQLENSMQAVHDQYIDKSFDPDYTVRMIVAARARDGMGVFQQSKWAATAVKAPPYVCIGSGAAFGNYVAERLFGDGSKGLRPVVAACITAAHLLQLAKQYVPGVGGKRSEIFVLPERGHAYAQSARNINHLEQFFDSIDAVLGPLLFAIPNPWVSQEDVEERLRVFCEGVRATRPFPFDVTLAVGGAGAISLTGHAPTPLIKPTAPSSDSTAPPNPTDPKDE